MAEEKEGRAEDNRLVFRGDTSSSVGPLVDEVIKKGWNTLTVSGDKELQRALWLEATMRGLTVNGYEPSSNDKKLLEQMNGQKRKDDRSIKLAAADVAADFSKRVIPQLRKVYEELRRNRRDSGITTTELDRAYGLNQPSGRFQKDINDRFFRAKSALLRAVNDLEHFQSLGKRTVSVKQNFEDGVVRFVLAEPEPTGSLSYTRSLYQRRY